MKKSDLKTGMKVIQSNGDECIALLGTSWGDYLVGERSHNGLRYYNEDLTNIDYKEHNIDEVLRPVECHNLRSKQQSFVTIWERKETPEYTMEEAIKLIGHNFKLKK